jgi:hypothetical protein
MRTDVERVCHSILAKAADTAVTSVAMSPSLLEAFAPNGEESWDKDIRRRFGPNETTRYGLYEHTRDYLRL